MGDTAGQEEFSSMQDQGMREGQAFLVVYSITSRTTFDEAIIMREKILRCKEEEDDAGDDAMDTDEDFNDDDDEAVEVDGLKGSTKGQGMDTLNITVFPAGAPPMQTVASHSMGDDEVVSHI